MEICTSSWYNETIRKRCIFEGRSRFMEKLFHVAEEYIKGMKGQDMALLKICLCAAGIIIGITAPKRWRKGLLALAAAAFVITYIPLMAKFVPAMRNLGCCGEE